MMFAPMSAVLSIGARVFLITNNKGAPPGWAQDGMYMATWAVLIQFLMVLFVGITSEKTVELEEDGMPKSEPTMDILKYVAMVLKRITFFFLYGGFIAVIVAVYTMTPETANGRLSIKRHTKTSITRALRVPVAAERGSVPRPKQPPLVTSAPV